MTDGEFQAQLVTRSPKIQVSLSKPEGESLKTTPRSLVMTATGTADLETALSALRADPAKLAMLEDQIAAPVALLRRITASHEVLQAFRLDEQQLRRTRTRACPCSCE